jgi:hypothetical protein
MGISTNILAFPFSLKLGAKLSLDQAERVDQLLF